MAIITAITAQRRDMERVNLFLDGEFVCGLPLVVADGLRVGQSLSADGLAHLQEEAAWQAAKEVAMKQLSYRPRSSAEITRKLQQKGFSPEQIERTLGWLGQQTWLDDEAFAAYWVEQRTTFRPRSRVMIRHELREKGVAEEEISSALAEVDEQENARRAVMSKLERWRGLDYGQFCQKLGRYLQGRGFSWEVIRPLCPELWQQIAPTSREAEEFDG